MAKFNVWAAYTVELVMTVEADTEDEAREIGANADGADFKEITRGDWRIFEINEVKE